MAEGNALYGDVAHGALCTTDKFHQCLENGNNSLVDSLAFVGQIIELVGLDVMIPLAGLIYQLFGIRQVERRRMFCVRCHRRWPWMLKLEFRLWVVKADSSRVALERDTLDAQVGGTPHLVQYHFGIGCLHDFLHRLAWHPQNVVLLVVGADAVHLFKVAHVACSDCLLSVHPQLSEVHRVTVEVGHISY